MCLSSFEIALESNNNILSGAIAKSRVFRQSLANRRGFTSNRDRLSCHVFRVRRVFDRHALVTEGVQYLLTTTTVPFRRQCTIRSTNVPFSYFPSIIIELTTTYHFFNTKYHFQISNDSVKGRCGQQQRRSRCSSSGPSKQEHPQLFHRQELVCSDAWSVLV